MTAPYYRDDSVTLYHGDAREIPEWLAADVMITDPPYGMDYKGFGGRKGEPRRSRGRVSVAGDESTEVRDTALSMWGERPALIFGRWNIERPSGVRNRLIWDKCWHGMGDLSMPWGPAEEEIYVFGAGWSGPRRSNIIRAQGYAAPDPNRPKHPTPKPVALMECLIEYAPGGVLVDPFSGSGATLIAARNLGRQVIGVELEEKYCELIASRLGQQAFVFEGGVA
jgi:DNA modification methylase